MNPKAALLLFLTVVIVVGALIALFVWWVGRQSGVRQRDFKRLQRQFNAAAKALDQIGEQTDLYSGIEPVLAPQIQQIIRDHNQTQRELSA